VHISSKSGFWGGSRHGPLKKETRSHPGKPCGKKKESALEENPKKTLLHKRPKQGAKKNAQGVPEEEGTSGGGGQSGGDEVEKRWPLKL